MVKLLADPPLRQTYERANAAEAENYDWSAIARRYAAVYDSVLSATARG